MFGRYNKWFKKVKHFFHEEKQESLLEKLSPLFILFLICILALSLGIGMLVYSNAPFSTVVDPGSSEVTQLRTFASETFQYHLKYPTSWTYIIEPSSKQDSSAQTEQVIFSRGRDHVRIVASTKPIIVQPLIPSTSWPATVSGQKADRYRDYDPETGAALDRIVVTKGSLTYEINGYGPSFERFLRELIIVP